MEKEILNILSNVSAPSKLSFEEFIERSTLFETQSCKRPTENNWMEAEANKNSDVGICMLSPPPPPGWGGSWLEYKWRRINSSYPILHESVLCLLQDFLNWKKINSTYEEELFLYKKEGFTVLDLVDRLICKRPLMFMGRHDQYVLRNGFGGAGDAWKRIGKGSKNRSDTKDNEYPNIEEYMTYDEIKLSAFL